MPCQDPFVVMSANDLLHREAALHRIVLYELKDKPISEKLKGIASGYYRGTTQVSALCNDIRTFGGVKFMEALHKEYPNDPDIQDVYVWWKEHRAADMEREKAEHQRIARKREARRSEARRASIARGAELNLKDYRRRKVDRLLRELVESVKKS